MSDAISPYFVVGLLKFVVFMCPRNYILVSFEFGAALSLKYYFDKRLWEFLLRPVPSLFLVSTFVSLLFRPVGNLFV